MFSLPRRNSSLPAMAGEASKRSSSLFVARISSLLPLPITTEVPLRLTKYTRPAAPTGEA